MAVAAEVAISEVIFTVNGGGVYNPRSADVVAKINAANANPARSVQGQVGMVFSSTEGAASFFASHSVEPSCIIFLRDSEKVSRFSLSRCSKSADWIPDWAHAATRGVRVGMGVSLNVCAGQIRAGLNAGRRVSLVGAVPSRRDRRSFGGQGLW